MSDNNPSKVIRDRLPELREALEAQTNLMNPNRVGAWVVAEVERLRAALAFYGEDESYDPGGGGGLPSVNHDRGAKARAALSGETLPKDQS